MHTVVSVFLLDNDQCSLEIQFEVPLVKVGSVEHLSVVNSLNQVAFDCKLVVHESV